MVTKTPSQLKLTDEATRMRAIERLKSHLNFQAAGYECTTETVLDGLIRAAVTRQTIETICYTWADGVDGETIRGYLNDQIRVDRLDHLEQQSNQIRVTGLPRRLGKTPLEIAIDRHDEPFYGHSLELLALTCGGEAHKGTTRFFRVTTTYVIFKEMRLTLALLFVRPEDDLAEIVAALLRHLRILGFKVRRLYLDKGFCSIPIIRYIAQTGWPVLLACPIRGKKGGPRGLCQGQASYLTPHTFKSQAPGRYIATVAVTRTYATHKRRKRKKGCLRWLVFVLVNAKIQPQLAHKWYRRRFGIETSYRCMRQVRAWTTSRNAALRFLLLSLAFMLLNLWVELRWQFCQIKRRGRRHIDTKRFELQRMVSFLNQAIEKIYGLVSFIVADVPPLEI